MVSRRQFLKHAVATGVIAAVGPSLIVKAAETFAAPAGGQLTYEMLEQTYQEAMLGREEPDMIVIHDIQDYRRLVRLVQKVNSDPRYRWEVVSDADVHV